MSQQQSDHRERLQNSLLAIQRLQRKLNLLEAKRTEPIAVVGIGCRFPGGADGPGRFWDLLSRGVDAITEIPPSRWSVEDYFDGDPEAAGKSYSRWGGFIEGVDLFDPQFFGISPREAASIDPQHRLLLETAWEALESAGTPPDSLSGQRAGVFIGITGSDYAHIVRAAGPDRLDAYSGTGSTSAFVAGRLSYVLGLQGPSVAVDTACSSSLSAVHLACLSLRAGESELALAGGVNVMLTPDMYISASRNRMLSPRGRCRTFDARADGFVRGEGCGVVVLKCLSRAQADGDPILAIIRGSAMNQDGASSGMTVPNKLAQEAVIRAALAAAGVRPHEVGYVEAHGTGTPLGDPIELRALGTVLEEGRSREAPFHVGSVKTNIGHLEAASGIAGLIKTVLMVKHGVIPAHLHLREPSPHIPWAEIPAVIPTSAVPWPAGERRRVAGVSSFGASGTNVHVVIEEAPPVTQRTAADEQPIQLLTISARTSAELEEQARRFRDHLVADGESELPDICFTAATGRAHHPARIAVVGGDTSQMVERLNHLLEGNDDAGVVRGEIRPGERRIAFLFTGQGAQYVGMGRELFRTQSRFREALERCAEVLGPRLDRPLLSLLYPKAGDDAEAERLISQTAYTQPALFALQFALCELWRSWGLEPYALLGHSVGEYTAACVAGVFSLEDGLALIAERGRLMQELPAGGAMAAAFVNVDCARDAIGEQARQVSIAAVNGPANTVLSGEEAALEVVLSRLHAKGVRTKRLRVSHAFHSALLDPALDAIEHAASGIPLRTPTLRLVSNLTGEIAGVELSRPQYWRQHAREHVQFARGVRTLEAMGCDTYLEIGPHPVLLGMAQGSVSAQDALLLGSLREGRHDLQEMLTSLARLHVDGASVDWSAFHGGNGRKVQIPTYAFQRTRHWVEQQAVRRTEERAGDVEVHPLLGSPLRIAGAQRIFESQIGEGASAYLRDHRVHGATVVPAAAFVEMIAGAASHVCGVQVTELESLTLHEPLELPDFGTRTVQTVITPERDGSSKVEIWALDEGRGAGQWHMYASAVARAAGEESARPSMMSPEASPLEELSRERHYEELDARGLNFGPAFRGVLRVWRQPGEATVEAELPHDVPCDDARYTTHPALFDACLQAVASALSVPTHVTYLPLSFARVRLLGRLENNVRAHATVRPTRADSSTLVGELEVTGGDGSVLIQVEGIGLRESRRSVASVVDRLLYETIWERKPHASQEESSSERVALDTLLAPAIHHAARLDRSDDAELLRDLGPTLDVLCAAYVADAMRELGWSPVPGEIVASEELRERLRVTDRHARLFARLLEILGDDGVLARRSAGWQVVGHLDDRPASTIVRQLMDRHPDSRGDLTLLARCGRALAKTLRGEQDPLELLFPDGSTAEAEHMYAASPFTREFNTLMAVTLGAIAGAFGDRTLKVLEIGAGTGGTTASVLPVLPSGLTEYTFTDVSALFVESASRKFSSFPALRGRTLDISRDPVEQGFTSGGFDLVIGANVIHATPDVRRALRHARSLLAPGGTLVLLECVAKQRFADLTVGLTDGWWSFNDQPLRSHALLQKEQWLALLRECGFESVAVSGPGAFASQSVLVARLPEPPPVARAAGKWMILADAGGVAARVAEHLRARGDSCLLVRPDSHETQAGEGVRSIDAADPAAYRELIADVLRGGGSLHGVVHLWALDHEVWPCHAGVTAERLDRTQQGAVGSALHLVQALAASGAQCRLCMVTRGARSAATGDLTMPWQAPLWGLGRSVELEHPELRCARVDLDPAGDVDEAGMLTEELISTSDENEIAFRRHERYVARLERGGAERHEMLPMPRDECFILTTRGAGVLENLALESCTRRPPAAGEVEVEVFACGVAFRDVLSALGQYPGVAAPLGGEFAGVISAVGSGVDEFRVGQSVVGMAAGAFRSYVTTGAALVAAAPVGLTMTQAASLPSAFLTAHHALHHLARLTDGDRVLVHAGAGGVGSAAIQIAQRVGAELFVTAGSPAKRAWLQSLGVRHVFDSRTHSFADEILRITEGRGVDVVLNSLSDGFIRASLSCLAEDGRFVELGKRGIWSAAEVASFRPGVSYYVVDLAAATENDPGTIEKLFREVLPSFERSDLRPLPVRTFGVGEAVAAFRHMAQARHTGKIVLVLPRPSALRTDATYLITGGLGGVGLSVASDMVERGARHLVLVGRNAPTESARQAMAGFEARGVRVRIVAADISRVDQIDALLTMIEAEMPPLRGIIHGALVLDDGALTQQSWERFQSVFAPRIYGAWLLHSRTAALPLDFFVLFSAAGAVLGSAGQSNYTAANTFLDSLAHHRSALGLPGLSVQWGLWSGVGRAAELGVDSRMLRQGIGAMSPRECIEALWKVLDESQWKPVQAVMRIDWPTLLRTGERRRSPFFSRLASERAAPGERQVHPDTSRPRHEERSLRRTIDEAPPGRRASLMAAHVRTQAAKVLSLGTDQAIDSRKPLQELGLDSLMAVELRSLLGKGLELGRNLPATLAFDYPSVDAITAFLIAELGGTGELCPAGTNGGSESLPEKVAESVIALTDAEAEALLLAELDPMRNSVS